MKHTLVGAVVTVSAIAIGAPAAQAYSLSHYNWSGTFTYESSSKGTISRTLSGMFTVKDDPSGHYDAHDLTSFTLDLGSLLPKLDQKFDLGTVDAYKLATDGKATLPLSTLTYETVNFLWSGDTFEFGVAESSKVFGFLPAAFFTGFSTQGGIGQGVAFASALGKSDIFNYSVADFTVSEKGSAAAIPEPTTMLGIGLAGAGLAALKKRQKAQQS